MIFDNILNRKIPWPRVPDDMSYEAKDLIDRLVGNFFSFQLNCIAGLSPVYILSKLLKPFLGTFCTSFM